MVFPWDNLQAPGSGEIYILLLQQPQASLNFIALQVKALLSFGLDTILSDRRVLCRVHDFNVPNIQWFNTTLFFIEILGIQISQWYFKDGETTIVALCEGKFEGFAQRNCCLLLNFLMCWILDVLSESLNAGPQPARLPIWWRVQAGRRGNFSTIVNPLQCICRRMVNTARPCD